MTFWTCLGGASAATALIGAITKVVQWVLAVNADRARFARALSRIGSVLADDDNDEEQEAR
ncbi:hypothetical protein [Streptacidiphilus sp. MAP5-3]|uniref:hypothetical protein n=1 Tax=unclassified Streptacidiphilus TaxID=2643834 RepID=UPI0035199A17